MTKFPTTFLYYSILFLSCFSASSFANTGGHSTSSSFIESTLQPESENDTATDVIEQFTMWFEQLSGWIQAFTGIGIGTGGLIIIIVVIVLLVVTLCCCCRCYSHRKKRKRRKRRDKRDIEFGQDDRRMSRNVKVTFVAGETLPDPEQFPPEYWLEELQSYSSEFYEIMDPFEKNFQAVHKKRLKVIKVERVHNARLEAYFLCRKAQLHDPGRRTVLKFHGTKTEETMRSILSHGFQLPAKNKRNMYGQGIYFATDSTKSERYITRGFPKMLVCEVALGKEMVVAKAMNELTPDMVLRHFDSVFAPRGTQQVGGVMHDEFVIYHPHQAVPRYVVTFQVESL